MIKMSFVGALVLAVASCAHSPQTVSSQQSLEQKADATLGEMRAQDPAIDNVLQSSYAYALFPDIGAAGAFLAGGAYGNGILYEQGRPTGVVELKQGSIGPQLGGQTFAELIVLRTPYDVARLKAGTFDLGANASAVVLKAGAAASADLRNGTAVFVLPHGGLMAGISVSGQTIDYHPLA